MNVNVGNWVVATLQNDDGYFVGRVIRVTHTLFTTLDPMFQEREIVCGRSRIKCVCISESVAIEMHHRFVSSLARYIEETRSARARQRERDKRILERLTGPV